MKVMPLLRRLASVTVLAWACGPALGDPATDFADGQALGHARKGETVLGIRNGTASATDPNFTAVPPQRLLYGNANLSSQTAVQQAWCNGHANDPACAAASLANAARPKQYLTQGDPALADGLAADDPGTILGNIASTYSACATDTRLVTPASYALSSCRIDTGAWVSQACSKTLTVAPKDTFNCTVGGVAALVGFGWGYNFRSGKDLYTNGGVARVYCQPSDRTTVLMGFFGGDVSEGDAGSGATFHPPPDPALLRDLDKLSITIDVKADMRMPRSGITILQGSGCDRHGDCVYNMRRGARSFTLKFLKPDFGHPAGDYWTNGCAPFEAQAVNAALPPDGVNPGTPLTLPVLSTTAARQCTRTRSVCADGPSMRVIDGVAVTRECWRYDNDFDCTTLQASTTCNDSALGACSQAGAPTCMAVDGAGHCLSAKVDLQCKVTEDVYAPAVNCGPAAFCPNGSCYDTSSPADTDFAQTVTMLEAAREAGGSVDPDNVKVFVGFDNRCIRKLFGLVNCCRGGGTGAAMAFTDLSVAASAVGAVGRAAFSSYTYNALFTSDAPDLVINGFEALFGTGLDSGLAGVIAGDLSVADFMTSLVPGPWTLAMLAIQFSGLLDCPKDAQITAMKKDANLCHAVGDYCSSRFLGICQERTQTYCCFTSRLARIINEQGRAQLGQNWGDPKAPACGGFSLAELQGLNFAAMDFTEFYAEIAPTLPNLAALQAGSVGKKASCYYGAGKC